MSVVNQRGETLKRRFADGNVRGETFKKAVERGERESNVWRGKSASERRDARKKKAGQLSSTGFIYHSKDFTQCLPIIAIPRKTIGFPTEFLISLERR